MLKVLYLSDAGTDESIREATETEASIELICEMPHTYNSGNLIPLLRPDAVLFNSDALDIAEVAKTIQSIKTADRDIRIIVLTSLEAESDILRLMEMEIDSLLEKTPLLHQSIVSTIDAVMSGDFIMPHHLTKSLMSNLRILKTSQFDYFSKRLEDGGVLLTNRETQVAYYLKCGLTNKEIARKLQVTEGVAKVHISHIYHKIESVNRQDAINKLNRLSKTDDQRDCQT